MTWTYILKVKYFKFEISETVRASTKVNWFLEISILAIERRQSESYIPSPLPSSLMSNIFNVNISEAARATSEMPHTTFIFTFAIEWRQFESITL